MKKIFSLFLAAGLLMTSCDKYDDSDLRSKLESQQSKLDDQAKRIAALESKVEQMNTNISSMQSILNALKDNDYVKSVTPVLQGGEEVGYIISFTKSDPVTIYQGKDGADGANGATPQIGVGKDSDGAFYWTLDGVWMTDGSGKKIPATGPKGDTGVGVPGRDGITPKLKIEQDYWHISYDGGVSWERLSKATGEDGRNGVDGENGDSFFKSVVVGENSVVLTLSDGTAFTLPLGNGPISFVEDAEQIISSSANKVFIDINETASKASYAATLEPVDAFISTKAAVGWEVELSMDSAGKSLIATVTPDEFTEMVLLTITRIAQEGSHRISKVLMKEPPRDLSLEGTSNCYIVSSAGRYKFPTVKGNSTESVGDVASAEVLWETVGTDTAPNAGDLVQLLDFADGHISFIATDLKGNASIAAKDGSGNILWSWHIWLTDQPADQVYNNNAGILMDRNLGAYSVTPGDIASLGLLYQWGRKDPFLGAASVSSNVSAVSTNSSVWTTTNSTASDGTIDYAVAHPTTFIIRNTTNWDWLYSDTKVSDSTRWMSSKTIYDPCPAGYRVPDGGERGVWCVALASKKSFIVPVSADAIGFNFSNSSSKNYFSSVPSCWYPAAGAYYPTSGIGSVGKIGWYHSCTHNDGIRAYDLRVQINFGEIMPMSNSECSYGYSVRCMKE